MNKIVITAGAGSIGFHLVDRFCERFPSSEIIVIDGMTCPRDGRNLTTFIMSDRIRLLVADITDMDSCLRIVDGASLVVHAAVKSHVDDLCGDSTEFAGADALRTHCLLEACEIREVPSVVHIGFVHIGFVHIGRNGVYGGAPAWPFGDIRYGNESDKMRLLNRIPRRTPGNDLIGPTDRFEDNLKRYTAHLDIQPKSAPGRAFKVLEQAA